jgi:hypothetical protein
MRVSLSGGLNFLFLFKLGAAFLASCLRSHPLTTSGVLTAPSSVYSFGGLKPHFVRGFYFG